MNVINDTHIRKGSIEDINSKIGNVNVGSNIQQRVAMNNFLTPIVFVSNNYHGVQSVPYS
jgi:hypothetical protein